MRSVYANAFEFEPRDFGKTGISTLKSFSPIGLTESSGLTLGSAPNF